MSSAEKPTSGLHNENTPTADDQGLLAKGRKMLRLGKKKEEEDKTPETARTMSPSASSLLPSPPLTSPPADRRASPRGSPRLHPAGVTVSPNRRVHRSSSPGLHSPASSQIFERNVQEPEDSSAIPAHIKTEDHIPAALDASSLAITDDHLNPDEVEIVMHAAHQPASAAVAASVSDPSFYSSLPQDDILLASHSDLSESVADYGSIDTTDVRRLSFISFADVVQAEHVENDYRDSVQFMSLSSTANRSPSPVRSPASSHGFSTSPPTSGAASEKGADFFKGARIPGSPTTTTTHGTHSPPLGGGGVLQIETMRQALRKTGSGDLSGARSQPLSAVSMEDGSVEAPPFK